MPEATPRHPLRALLGAQFVGAFNDNAWKFVVTLLAIERVLAGAQGAEREIVSQQQTTLTFVIFALPIVLFSLPAGVFADRLSKRSVILAMKAVEWAILMMGTCVLLFAPEETPLLLATLALLGVQTAFFSPAKYGILPELVPHSRLSEGNGSLEMWTFFAVIAGTAAAGPLTSFSRNLGDDGEWLWLAGAGLALFSAIGFLVARGIPHVKPARSSGGLRQSTAGAWRAIRAERVLWLTVLGTTFYWSLATLVMQEIIVYSKTTLAAEDVWATLPVAVLGVGIGLGCILAGKLSGGKVELGLIPLGAAGLGVFLLALGFIRPTYWWTLALVLPLGISGGFVNVPLAALLQWRSPEDRRGGVIALTNVLTFAGMIAGSLTAFGMAQLGRTTDFGVTAAEGFIAAGALTLVGTVWAIRLVPEAFLRLVLVLLTHTIYRLRTNGLDNVPQRGGALLVPNHVSFADGLFLIASVDRPIRFLVDASYFSHPFLKPFMKALGAIPISSAEGPRVVLRALRDAGKYLDEGRLVCIFAEGQITRTGTLLPFQRGVERIVKGRNAPIIPIHLDRVWGSIFSHSGGRFLAKRPERIPYPVTVTFGDPLPPGTQVHQVRQAVHELGELAWTLRQQDRKPVHHSFIREARRHPFRLAFADENRPYVSHIKALTGAVALARSLRPKWKDQENVGVLLPPSIGAALVNIAAAFSGRTSVNLNFTAGREAMASAVGQAKLDTVVTSRRFLKKASLELPEGLEPVWLEDAVAGIGLWSKFRSAVIALLASKRRIEKSCGAQRPIRVEDTLTVIFSSGSTGDPKGVMLTHGNIDANVEAVTQVLRPEPNDRLLGVLPLFHSFGYMALWFAANRGLGTVFHPNPLDAAKVGDLVLRHNVTVMMATPTFLQLYLRRCTPAQFGSLRIVVAGAEKLSERLATAFEDYFGLRPLQGYGATECSPAITVSTLDYRAPGFFQPGSRRGTVGQPLPGVAVRIVDPESFDELLPDTAGLILVKGPNVMKGYLGNEVLTAKVLRDGWYVTGDIGLLDKDGFLTITDRISRFSKIGGEMVPHGKVEEALQDAADEQMQVFAVTAVPDEKKGERLAVLHTIDPDRLPKILEKLVKQGLPNLFIPRSDQFLRVESLPLLGTGKTDLRAVKQLASDRLKKTEVQEQ